ncbi:hypothetical protein NDI76_02175 [Halogeometricum sp. S1BR25-6]|uniref:DUF222 domain-containing protein n=1 Tax=Halogeometricum salsisoli TaxID=2950536 RepID=A0ABU2GBQ0_9EURY|nr:hypothetical protein [Halogeometricum sp. S1BR25-6]MDS0297548.1 hypothetical protein [Halogeometricum sp. S1BR25-6]
MSKEQIGQPSTAIDSGASLNELMERLDELEKKVDHNRSDQERRMSQLAQRVTGLEEGLGIHGYDGRRTKKYDEWWGDEEQDIESRIASLEALLTTGVGIEVEVELSQMERILCGLEERPSPGTSKSRAVILAELMHDLSGTRTPTGHTLAMDNHSLKSLVSQREIEQPGSDLSKGDQLTPRQIARAMKKFADLWDGKAKHTKNDRGVNIVHIDTDDYNNAVWSQEELRANISDKN